MVLNLDRQFKACLLCHSRTRAIYTNNNMPTVLACTDMDKRKQNGGEGRSTDVRKDVF